MARTIIITESQQELIRQSLLREAEEIFFNSFQNALRSFLGELLTHPTEPKYPEFFNKIGVERGELVKKMEDLGLVTRTEKLTDNGEAAKMDIKYTVPRQNFRTKALKLYDDLCGKNKLDECDAGAAGGDAGGSAFGGGEGPGFMNGVTSTETVGDFRYDVPFSPKKRKKGEKDPSMIHRNLTTDPDAKH